MGVGEGNDNNLFIVFRVDDDVGKTFESALPQVRGNRFPTFWEVNNSSDDRLELFDKTRTQPELYCTVVIKGFDDFFIDPRQPANVHKARNFVKSSSMGAEVNSPR